MRGKDPEQNTKHFEKCLDIIKGAGVSLQELRLTVSLLTLMQKKVGTIAKDTSVGPFIDEWKKAFDEISKDVEEVDITPALSAGALAVKDENELVSLILLYDSLIMSEIG